MTRFAHPIALALIAAALLALAGCGAGAAASAGVAAPVATADTRARVAPSEGQCPASHPIKAVGIPNDRILGVSPIYHVPGGEQYDRIRAMRCYITEAAASGDGYQRARR